MATCRGGDYKVSEDFQAFEARCQDSRHFEAVDSELTSWETSKTLADKVNGP